MSVPCRCRPRCRNPEPASLSAKPIVTGQFQLRIPGTQPACAVTFGDERSTSEIDEGGGEWRGDTSTSPHLRIRWRAVSTVRSGGRRNSLPLPLLPSSTHHNNHQHDPALVFFLFFCIFESSLLSSGDIIVIFYFVQRPKWLMRRSRCCCPTWTTHLTVIYTWTYKKKHTMPASTHTHTHTHAFFIRVKLRGRPR